MKNKYDWNALETEFVQGNMTVSALAKKHCLKYATVYKRYKSYNWEKLREENQSDENKEAKEIDIADKLLDVLDEAINDKRQFYRYIVKEKNGSDSGEEERIFGKMDMQALNNAIKALDSLQEIKRVITGKLSPVEEKKLLMQSEESDNDQQETGVVILPEVEDE